MINKAGIDYLNSQLPFVFDGNDPELEIVFLSRYSVSNREKRDKEYHISLTGVGRGLQSVLIDQYIIMNCWQDERIHSELSAALKPRFSNTMLDLFDALKECYILVNNTMDISFRNDSDIDPDITVRLLAYVYYHDGYSAAYSIIETAFAKMNLQNVARDSIIGSYSKTLLQEITQRTPGQQPMYLVEQEGVSHKSVFKCMVILGNKNASGIGSRKKEAEFDAAKNYMLKYHSNDPSLKRFNIPFSKAVMVDPIIPSFLPMNPALKKLDLEGSLLLSCLYTIENYKRKYKNAKGFYQGNTGLVGDRLMFFLIALIAKEMMDNNDPSIVMANFEFPSLSPKEDLYLSIGELYGIKDEMIRVNRSSDIEKSQVAQAVRAIITMILLEKIRRKEFINDIFSLYDLQVKEKIEAFIREQFKNTNDSKPDYFLNASNTLNDVSGICMWNVNVIAVNSVPYKDAPKSNQGMGFEAVVELTIAGKKICSGKAIGINKKDASNLAKEVIWNNVYQRFSSWTPDDPVIRTAFMAACNMKRPPKSRKLVYDLLLKRLPQNPIILSSNLEQAKNYIILLYSMGERDLSIEMDYLVRRFIKSMLDMPVIDSLMSNCPELVTDELLSKINKIAVSHLKY